MAASHAISIGTHATSGQTPAISISNGITNQHTTSTIIQLPADVARFRAGMSAVRARAIALDAAPDALRRALQTLLAEMHAGRSSAAAVALANSALKPQRRAQLHGGAA